MEILGFKPPTKGLETLNALGEALHHLQPEEGRILAQLGLSRKPAVDHARTGCEIETWASDTLRVHVVFGGRRDAELLGCSWLMVSGHSPVQGAS